MRKLATIRRISSVEPIEGADLIEAIRVDGWQCVARKGEFKVADLCVFFEVDSFLPIEERYEFLRKSSYKKVDGNVNDTRSEGFRLKTVRLRKTLSQGLAMPLRAFGGLLGAYQLGDDLTEVLNIEKYEPAIHASLSGIAKGAFPGFIKKTDEERIQNLPQYFKLYKDMGFEVTEKLDGSSMTVYLNDGEFGVCSRNLDLLEDESNTFWKMARELELERILKSTGCNLALQGELVGEGIQKNPLKIKGHRFYLFNIWDMGQKRHLTTWERKVMYQDYFATLFHVPVIAEKEMVFETLPTMKAMLEYAIGPSLIGKHVQREGVVFKSTELVGNEVLSFKAISNNYLLKHGE